MAVTKALREAREEVVSLKASLGKGQEISEEDELKIVDKKSLKSSAALITNWSFDQECNEANKIKFLQNAPHVKDLVERFSSNRANFLASPSSN